MLRQLGRRSQQRACGWQAAHWAAASSFSGGGSGPTASWVLVQREGDRSTTAVGGGGAGEVQLQRRYHQEGDAPGMAAASSLSLARLRQVAVSQLQATFLPTVREQCAAA